LGGSLSVSPILTCGVCLKGFGGDDIEVWRPVRPRSGVAIAEIAVSG
jgi:hypothetical protein